MATLFSHLRFPPRKAGPTDLEDFQEGYIDTLFKDPFIPKFWVGFSAVVGPIVGVFIGSKAGVAIGILAGLGLAWLVISGTVFVSYAFSCCDYGGMSLVWLPWRQRWTWALVVFTLPWAIFWLISALRLAINWKKTRPSPLPLDYGI